MPSRRADRNKCARPPASTRRDPAYAVIRTLAAVGIGLVTTLSAGCGSAIPGERYVIEPAVNLRDGVPARNPDGTINAAIEIPAGTNDKWQVEDSGVLAWEFVDGSPRVVDYLPYPCNYGSIPSTLQSEATGGDGDPLDVLVLGPAEPRGSIVRARLVGVLRLIDDGEQDDKLIAVPLDGPLSDVTDLSALQQTYPGSVEVLAIWFGHYKGPERLVVEGLEDRPVAESILDDGIEAWASMTRPRH